MKLVYFSWVRERIGLAEEDVSPPAEVSTVRDLLVWLRQRGPEYEAALQYPEAIRVAIDREHARHKESIAGAREIGIFPPMTGG